MNKIDSQDNNLILVHIEKIANQFKNSKLSEQNKKQVLKLVQEEVKILSRFLHCSEDEAWVFSIMFAMGISGKESDLDSLTHFLACNPFFIVSLSPILEGLVQKRLIIKNTGYDMRVLAMRFYVSNYIFNAISLNKPIVQNNHFKDIYAVIERISEMIVERERNGLSTEELFIEVFSLLESEKDFALIRKILDLQFSDDDTLLLLYLCYTFANDANEADVERYVYYVYDSIGNKIRVKKNLLSGNSQLIAEELVAFNEESFYGGKEVKLTHKAIDILFAEDISILEKNKSFIPKNCLILEPPKIRFHHLFFNEQEDKQISFIQKLLEENNLKKAIHKFEQLDFPSGITLLLYGDPGTGKTQVVYNIAKQSNRHIMMVDIANIRDKYVGESEKKIKQIFKTYKQAKEYYEHCPILFFNESDALISKRYEVNTSVDQMNNSMQNILLQELEDFEGVLIATSNLNMNLDKAFERRFLYKVSFEKPNENTRFKIWQTKFPELEEDSIKILAKAYELTGGQINNISRKYILENILNDSSVNLEALKELCELEYFGKTVANLGF